MGEHSDWWQETVGGKVVRRASSGNFVANLARRTNRVSRVNFAFLARDTLVFQ